MGDKQPDKHQQAISELGDMNGHMNDVNSGALGKKMGIATHHRAARSGFVTSRITCLIRPTPPGA